MSICTAPIYELKEFNNLFINMTQKNCNKNCKSCYIDFPQKKDAKDFIKIDTVKEALHDLSQENIHCIYLTGAEPMTHPDFNTILRLCLKRCNVCICTNASFLNEKKIRFLKKVEEEGLYLNAKNSNMVSEIESQIFFRFSLTHYDEKMNDNVKYRGHYRQNIHALKILERYNFNSVLSIQNYYNLDKEEIINNFREIFQENSIKNTDIQVVISYPHNIDSEVTVPSLKTDCMYGRTLSQTGIYCCPFLLEDYRGRVGSSFKNYSKTINAETDYCSVCQSNNDWIFSIG